jgi:hypothetical protein
MCALRMSSCKLLVKMNSLKDTEDTEMMLPDTKGANDDTEVAQTAAMAGKLSFEHVENILALLRMQRECSSLRMQMK